jgi:dUTPase
MGKVIKMPTQAERLGIVETKVENLDSTVRGAGGFGSTGC